MRCLPKRTREGPTLMSTLQYPSPEKLIIDSADPIKDHALLYYVKAYTDVKRQLDEVAAVVIAELLANASDVIHPEFLSIDPGGPLMKPALSGEKLRHEIKRILHLL